MADWTAAQLQTARNIVAVARAFYARTHVPELAHLAATLQESSLIDTAIGDDGRSFGPYQLYQPAHPDTDQLAVSPWANYAFHVMADSWAEAWAQHGGGWENVANRGAILEAFVPAAQGSVIWEPGLGALRYAEALDIYERVS